MTPGPHGPLSEILNKPARIAPSHTPGGLYISLEVYVLASGSSANSMIIRDGGTMVMLDCGLSGKQAALRMADFGLDPGRLDALLISHEHGDHIRGIGVMSRRYKLPVYGTVLTHHSAGGTVGRLYGTRYIDSGEVFRIGDIEITPFPLSHDAADPTGYVFRSNGHKVSVCTDTGVYDRRILSEIHGSDLLVLESNHDVRMLRDGPYPEPLKERIAGRLGHLSNEDAGRLLLDTLTGRTRAVMLAHLSQENNHPGVARATVMKMLEEEINDLPEIHVAQRYEVSRALRI